MNVSILNCNYSLLSNLGKCICKINRGYSIIYFIYYENFIRKYFITRVIYIYRKLYEISKPIYWFTSNSLNYYFAHNWMNKKIFYLLLLSDLCQIYFRIKLECKCDIKLPTLLSYIHIKIWHFRIQNIERDKRKKNWNKNARQISL